jgi:hypothetical protein
MQVWLCLVVNEWAQSFSNEEKNSSPVVAVTRNKACVDHCVVLHGSKAC